MDPAARAASDGSVPEVLLLLLHRRGSDDHRAGDLEIGRLVANYVQATFRLISGMFQFRRWLVQWGTCIVLVVYRQKQK